MRGSVERPGDSPFGRALRQGLSRPSARLGLTLVVAFVLCACFAGIVSPYPPVGGDVADKNLRPLTGTHLLGTDDLGNDVLARVLHGTRTSLLIGLTAVTLAALVGVSLGAVAGYAGGWLDAVLMRMVDVLLAFPSLLLAIAVVSLLGPGLWNVVVAVGVVGIPAFARQVRASVLAVKGAEFVLAARAVGSTPVRILLRTVLPNCVGPLTVLATLGIGSAILEAAGLGFLGLGPEPGTPEWGADISLNRRLFLTAPWAVMAPGAAIAAAVLAFNLLGDALRDALDVRSR